jgi:putative adhesin
MENGRIERTFTLSPGAVPTIVARTPSGTMQIHGEERADVAVTVTCNPADAIGRDLEIVLEEQGETIHAEVRGPNRGDSLFGWLRGTPGNVRIAMEIHTPVRSDIEAEGGSTSMQLERLEGTIRARTASGDVRADRLTKMVTIQTASGDIRAHVLNGGVRIQSASGDVTLERGDGELNIQTASGDLELDRITGTLDVATASGDCRVRASALASCRAKTASGDLTVATPLAPDGEYDFGTVSGDLLLQVPEATRMTVAMKTVSGDLSCALPATSEGGKRSRTLAVNGGGVPVRVKSVSGDCAIRAASGDLPPLPATPSVARGVPAPAAPPAPPAPAPPLTPVPMTQGASSAAQSDPPEDGFSETLAVLQAVERGELTIDEAMEKLATLEGGAQP